MSDFLNAINEVNESKQLAINTNGKQVFGVPVKLVNCKIISKAKEGKKEIDPNYPDIQLSFKGTSETNDGYLNERIYGSVFNEKHEYYNKYEYANSIKMLTEFLKAFTPTDKYNEGIKLFTELINKCPNDYIALIKAFFGGDKPIFNVEFAKTVKDAEILVVLSYKEDKVVINRDKYGKMFSTEILPQPLSKAVDGKYIKVKPTVPDTEPSTPELEIDGITDTEDDLPF